MHNWRLWGDAPTYSAIYNSHLPLSYFYSAGHWSLLWCWRSWGPMLDMSRMAAQKRRERRKMNKRLFVARLGINQLPVLATRCPFHQYFKSSFFTWKFFCAAFMCLQFGFVFFWQKDFGANAAHKMWVKLTPGGSIEPTYILTLLFSENLQDCQ